MSDLSSLQLVLIALLFVWSGFVRSGLGFGGAVLSLPFLLLVHNDVLLFLPIVAAHLLFFTSLIFLQNYRDQIYAQRSDGAVDWIFLRRAMKVMIIPKLIGVFGLITLPNDIMSVIVFVIVSVYSASYILNKPFSSQNRLTDRFLLALGGYISGTSLIAAPLITSVFAAHVKPAQLRDTLFVLWFILVTLKMGAFVYFGVDLNLIHHLWLLPCAWLGHILGLKLHAKLKETDPKVFYRVLGFALALASVSGLAQTFFIRSS